ncbi:MAG: type VI secretion system tip protein VgrG [Bacteroidota bacterium]
MPLVTATIKSDEIVMNPNFELLSIDISKEFNKIPVAELKLIEGDIARNEFTILDGGFFAPGKQVEIALKYQDDSAEEEVVFVGVVVHQGLELNRTGTTLLVEMNDAAVKMTAVRNNALFADKKDSAIIQELVQQNGLTAGIIAGTPLAHAQMVQYYASDWDFCISRAEANGHLLIADDGKISTQEPKIGAPVLQLELGRDHIFDFDLQVNGRDQLGAVESVAWDIAKQALTKPHQGEEFKLAQGDHNLDQITKVVGGEKATLVHPVALHPTELKSWADAQVVKSRLSLVRGTLQIPGTVKVKVGQTIEIKGVSERFTGKNIVSGVRHQITATGWVTSLQLGMDANWFSARTRVVDTQAAGLLPGVNGLQIGRVVAQEKDPNHEFRLKVDIPAFDRQKGAVWARLTSLDAGAERGVFFRPEVGDEVVMGFLNDDPRQAIVLGSLHSSANPPPVTPTPENGVKGLFTRKQYQLQFDEENETITLSTSAKNRIAIDEKAGCISIQDAHGNVVEMGPDGLLLDCAQDCTIKTKGDFSLDAKGNVKIAGKKVDLI